MKVYILRWNPSHSFYSMDKHLELISHVKKGQYPADFIWPMHDWDPVRVDDLFILLQVGTENDGIAMIGKCSGRIKNDSGEGNASLLVFEAIDLTKESKFRAENFAKDININWHDGKDEELLSEETGSLLIAKIKEAVKDSKQYGGISFEEFLDRRFDYLGVYNEEYFDVEAEKAFCKEKREDLLKTLSTYNHIVYTRNDADYNWLNPEESRIELFNTDKTKSIQIDMQYGGFSLDLDPKYTYHLTDEDYNMMRNELLDLLSKEF